MYMDLWDIKCVKSSPLLAKCANDGFFECVMSIFIRNFIKCLHRYNYKELITKIFNKENIFCQLRERKKNQKKKFYNNKKYNLTLSLYAKYLRFCWLYNSSKKTVRIQKTFFMFILFEKLNK